MQIREGKFMSLFGKKQPEVPQTFIVNEAAEAAGVDHNNVLDYLLQLKTEEYDKLLKLTEIYREANKKAGELIPQYDPDLVPEIEIQAMGQAETIKVRVEGAEEDDADIADLLNDEDDELAAAFLETEPKAKGKTAHATKAK